MGQRPMTAKARRAASERMRQAWITRRGRAALATAHMTPLPPPASNGHPSVEHRLVLRVQGTEITLNVGEARQLREALTEALPTP
jgi:hypothetical protein